MYMLRLIKDNTESWYVEIQRESCGRITTVALLFIPNGHDFSVRIEFIVRLKDAYSVLGKAVIAN
jgi:hypothetical protein